MKRMLLIIALLGTSSLCGLGQGLTLNAGDVFTFEFNNLQFESHLPVPTDAYTRVLIGKQNFTGSFLFEAFEDNSAQAPLFSADVVAGVNPSSDFYFGPAWQDLQGVIQITMESGSMTIPVMLGAVVTPTDDVYSQSVNVIPEPTVMALLFAGAMPLLLMRRRKARFVA